MSKMISLEKARKKYELKFVTAHLLENLYPLFRWAEKSHDTRRRA